MAKESYPKTELLSESYQFSTAAYGLGKYTRADAGEQPTVLHLFIKMLEQEYLNSGKLTVGGDALTVSGAAGSMYMTQFWGHDQNLTYYVNHVYPIMSGSTGATADRIILKDGDVVDVAMFDDWSFWGDAYAGFQYFMDGDAPTHSYTATAGEAKTITCKTAQTNMMSPSGTQYNVCGTQTVYYGKTLFASDAQSVTTDSSGAASITFPEAGDWYVWANGAKGKSTNNVVSSPAYAAVTVEAGGVTTPKLTLTTDKESVIWNEKVTVTATNEKGEPVVCNWTVNDPSVMPYRAKNPWDGQSSIAIKGTEVKNALVLTATSVDDPTLQGELQFNVLPLAEVYAVFGDGTKQPLTMKAETRAVGNGTFNVIEIPAAVDHILVRPAKGYTIIDNSGPATGTPLWTPEYDSEGFCAVTRAQGDLSKTTFAPERVLFTRGILPKYPESDWFCNRIKVEKEHVFLAWEQDTDSPIQEVKVENATLYTPVQTAQNSFITVTGTLLGGKGTTRNEIFDVAVPKWGYADTCYNGLNPYTGAEGGEVFDLDWAVDENGQPVKLDWVKYVKVQTASNVDGGGIGEKSTEVSAIYKTDAAAAPVGVTAAPASISINGQKLALKDGVDVYSAVADTAVEVAVDAPEGANVYINDVYGKSAKFDSLNHRMVRVVVQEGEKEPVIYYVNLKTQAQADEDAVADVIAKIDAIGEVTKDSGSSIKAARKAYDALSDAQKELVTNYQTLLDAEKSYKKLTRPTGGSSSSSTTDDKKNDGKDVKSGNTGDAGITLYLGMGLVAVMAGAVIVTRKRKEN